MSKKNIQVEVVPRPSSSRLTDLYKTDEFRNEWANDDTLAGTQSAKARRMSAMENQDNINEASPIEKRNQDLLDRFAAAALTGYLAASAGDTDYPEVEDAAKDAYDYAEAMMAERLKRDEVGLPK